MKSSLLSIFFGLLSTAAVVSQDAQQRIEAIRAEYGRLQNENHQTHKISWEDPDGPLSGEATFFHRGDMLRAVHVSLFEGGHSFREIRFYYEDGLPFFIFEEAGYWSFVPDEADKTIDHVTENRLYLDEAGQSVVRHLQKSYKGHTEDELKRHAGEAENREIGQEGRGRAVDLVAQAHAWTRIEKPAEALQLYLNPESLRKDAAEAMLREFWEKLADGEDVASFLWKPESGSAPQLELPRETAKNYRIDSMETLVASDQEKSVRLHLKPRDGNGQPASLRFGLIQLDGAWQIVAGSQN